MQYNPARPLAIVGGPLTHIRVPQKEFAMKRISTLVAAAALAASMVCAQVGVSVGARGTFGMNLGTTPTAAGKAIDTKEYPNVPAKNKLLVGGGGAVYCRYNMPFHTPLGVQLEVGVFANNGSKLAASSSFVDEIQWNVDLEATAKRTYLSMDIPLLITYDIAAGPVVITPFVGPNFSILLGKLNSTMEATTKYADSTGTLGYSMDDVNESEEGQLDFSSRLIPGIAAGVAVSLQLGPGALMADLRYVNDFTPVSVKPGTGSGALELFTRRRLDISLGYELRF